VSRRSTEAPPSVTEPFAPPPGRASASRVPGDHCCYWEAVGVQLRAGDRTAVLLRCDECQTIRTELLEGTWTIGQVRGLDMGDSPADDHLR
jgi:hypothetical protein